MRDRPRRRSNQYNNCIVGNKLFLLLDDSGASRVFSAAAELVNKWHTAVMCSVDQEAETHEAVR